jgi:lysophospholipase L1-like esterase
MSRAFQALIRTGAAAATVAVAACSSSASAGTTTATATVTRSTTVTVTASAQAPSPTPPSARVRVVLFGDSLLYGGPLPASQDFYSVMSTDRPDLDVLNMAIGGNDAAGLLYRLHDVTDAHPDVVVLWIGTNDAGYGVPQSKFHDEMEQLVGGLAPARVVLVTPMQDPANPSTYLPYVDTVRGVATEHSLPLVDLAGKITAADYLPNDTHLTADAIQRCARLIEAQLPAPR